MYVDTGGVCVSAYASNVSVGSIISSCRDWYCLS